MRGLFLLYRSVNKDKFQSLYNNLRHKTNFLNMYTAFALIGKQMESLYCLTSFVKTNKYGLLSVNLHL